jgi:hypothetical protein
LSRRRIAGVSHLLYGKIYFKVKKIALECIDSNLMDMEADSDDFRDLDVVRTFIVKVFRLSGMALRCPRAAKNYLEIMKLMPNRHKLIKLLQNIKTRKIDEGSLIICMFKFHEIK